MRLSCIAQLLRPVVISRSATSTAITVSAGLTVSAITMSFILTARFTQDVPSIVSGRIARGTMPAP